jgi:ammonium transporter, Amt family
VDSQRQADGAGRDLRRVAGLVAITPASGFVQPMSALRSALRPALLLVHGVRGEVALRLRRLAGRVRRARSGRNAGRDADRRLCRQRHQSRSTERACNIPTGAIDGHWSQILNQLTGVGVAWGISIVGTLILLFVVDKIMGLRVTPEQEQAGLDLSQHGEEGYDFNS